MTNWAERAEHERKRLATERATQDTKSTYAKLAKENEQEEVIREKLKLFDDLQITAKLREIQKDIWGGRGTLGTQETSFDDERNLGSIIQRLTTRLQTIKPLEKDVTRRVDGPYRVTRTAGQSGQTFDEVHHGPHNEHIGYKLAGEEKGEVEFYLLSSLGYSLPENKYALTIVHGGNFLRFAGSNVNMTQLEDFIDANLLKYAMDPPDLTGIENATKIRKAFIAKNLGKIVTGYNEWEYRTDNECSYPEFPLLTSREILM